MTVVDRICAYCCSSFRGPACYITRARSRVGREVTSLVGAEPSVQLKGDVLLIPFHALVKLCGAMCAHVVIEAYKALGEELVRYLPRALDASKALGGLACRHDEKDRRIVYCKHYNEALERLRSRGYHIVELPGGSHIVLGEMGAVILLKSL